MKPVAWMDRDGEVMPMPEIPNWCPPHTMMYSADQLRQAKAEVLREIVYHGIEGLCSEAGMRFILARADEIEKGEL